MFNKNCDNPHCGKKMPFWRRKGLCHGCKKEEKQWRNGRAKWKADRDGKKIEKHIRGMEE